MSKNTLLKTNYLMPKIKRDKEAKIITQEEKKSKYVQEKREFKVY